MIEIKKLNEKKSLTTVAEVERGSLSYDEIVALAKSFGPGWYCYDAGTYNGNRINLGYL